MKKEQRMELIDRNLFLLSRITEALIRIKNGEPKCEVVRDLKIPKYSFQVLFSSYKFAEMIEDEIPEPETVEQQRGVPTLNGYENLYGAVTGLTSIEDIPSDVEDTMRRAMKEVLRNREIQVLKMRYWSFMTLDEVSAALGVTRSRVGAIEHSALRKLKARSSYLKLGHKQYQQMKDDKLAAELEAEEIRLKELNKIKDKLLDIRRKEVETIGEIVDLKLKQSVNRVKLDSVLIEDMGLSVRSYNCLKRARINTLGDLRKLNLWSLHHIRNLGSRSVSEVISKYEMFTKERFDMNDDEPPENSEE